MKSFYKKCIHLCAALIMLGALAQGAAYAESIEEMDRRGDDFFKNKNYSEAYNEWSKALEQDPGNIPVKEKIDMLFREKLLDELSVLKKKPESGKISKIKIDWDDIRGAVMYRVQVQDGSGKTVQEETIKKSEIELSLSPGTYRMRIGVINKFKKTGKWSDWEDISIVKGEAPGVQGPALNLGMKIGAGFALSTFNQLTKNTTAFNDTGGALINIGIYGKSGFLRYMGLDFDASYAQYNSTSGDTSLRSNMTIMTGVGLFLTTGLSFPVNLYIRGGGGMAFSGFQYIREDSTRETLWSSDPYIKFGASIEYKFYSRFYLEAGADYIIVKYIASNFKLMRYYVLAGVRL